MRRRSALVVLSCLVAVGVLVVGAAVWILRPASQGQQGQPPAATLSTSPQTQPSIWPSPAQISPSAPNVTARPSPSSPHPSSSSPTPRRTEPTASGGFRLGQRPFASSSSWNTPVAATARYTPLAWKGSFGVNWEVYTPAVHVAKDSDPLVGVRIPVTWNWPAQTLRIRIPRAVSGAQGTDGELLVINGDTVHNFWQFQRTSDTTATAAAYGRTSLVTGTGWADPVTKRGAGIVATASSQLAGLLVQAETDAGEIRHALHLAVAVNLNRPGSTGEALGGDGTSATGIMQEGQRLAIPPSTSMPPGLSPLGRKVFRALQTYGAFDVDNGDYTTTLMRAQANAYAAATIAALRRDVPRLLPLLQRVD